MPRAPRKDEKCTEQLPPLRVPAELLDDVKDLAYLADRSVSDYVRWVLVCHVYGHARRVVEDSTAEENIHASQCDKRKGSR